MKTSWVSDFLHKSYLKFPSSPWEKYSMQLNLRHEGYHLIVGTSTYLFIFSQPGSVVNVWRDQIEPVLLWQDSQEQDHGAAATLADSVVDHLAGERKDLEGEREKRHEPWVKTQVLPSMWQDRMLDISSGRKCRGKELLCTQSPSSCLQRELTWPHSVRLETDQVSWSL